MLTDMNNISPEGTPTVVPDLEKVCDSCGGVGHERYGFKRIKCMACDGVGYVPTPFGAKVLAFIHRRERGA